MKNVPKMQFEWFMRVESMAHSFIGVSQGIEKKIRKYMWGFNEEPIYIDSVWYKLSNMREKALGRLAMTQGGLYLFTGFGLLKPSLRLHWNLLQCKRIRHANKRILFELPPLSRIEQANPMEVSPDEDGPLNPEYIDIQIPVVDELREPEEPKEENVYEQAANMVADALLFGKNADNRASLPDGKPEKIVVRPYKPPFAIEKEREDLKPPKRNKSLDEMTLLIQTPFATYLFKKICGIIRNMTWHVDPTLVTIPKLTSSLLEWNNVEDKRPEYSLMNRAILMAHYVFSSGKNLECADYFQTKWNGDSTLVLGKSFHPGGYAGPFGCAVGWEYGIDTVCLQNAHFKYMSAFVSCLLRSAQTVKSIGFSDYPRGCEIDLKIVGVKRTRVGNWLLVNCGATAANAVITALGDLPEPIESLTIARHSYNKNDAGSIFEAVQAVENITNTKSMSLVALNFKDFPKTAFSSMCCSFKNLQSLELKKLNVDGSVILDLVCSEQSNIKKLELISMRFADDVVVKKKLPKSLVSLDISKSRFVGISFVNFLKSVTAEMSEMPFFMIATNLELSEDCFAVGNVDYSKANSNVLELDLSNNRFPRKSFPIIFGFINSQKRMRNIVFDNIMTDDQRNFAHNLSMAVISVRMHGVDLSGQFDPLIIHQFLASLGSCLQLRRLSVKNCSAGDKGYDVLMDVHTLLKSLNEVLCDGMRPSTGSPQSPMISWWKFVADSGSLMANDSPHDDFAILGMDIRELVGLKEFYWISKLASPYRCTPTTLVERRDFLLEGVLSDNQEAISKALSPDVYFYINSTRIPESCWPTRARTDNLVKTKQAAKLEDVSLSDDSDTSSDIGNIDTDSFFDSTESEPDKETPKRTTIANPFLEISPEMVPEFAPPEEPIAAPKPKKPHESSSHHPHRTGGSASKSSHGSKPSTPSSKHSEKSSKGEKSSKSSNHRHSSKTSKKK